MSCLEAAGLVLALVDLIPKICSRARDVAFAEESAINLSNRVYRTEDDLRRLMKLNDSGDRFKKHLENLMCVFQNIDAFFAKMSKTGWTSVAKKIIKGGKYEAKYIELHKSLDSAKLDLILALNAGLATNEMEAPSAALPIGRDHHFPPTMQTTEQTIYVVEEDVSAAPGESVVNEPDDDIVLPHAINLRQEDWKLGPRPPSEETSGVMSPSPTPLFVFNRPKGNTLFSSVSESSDSVSASVLRFLNGRREECHRIAVLRDIAAHGNVGIKSISVVLSKLEYGDTSNHIYATQGVMKVARPFIALAAIPILLGGLAADLGGLALGYEEPPTNDSFAAKTSRLANGIRAQTNILVHFSVEFELDIGIRGTIENCVDDIHLYEGGVSRGEEFCVLFANLEEIGRTCSFNDLVRIRNEERVRPYSSTSNNCKHFAFHVIKSLVGEYDGRDLKRDTFQGFRNSCQNAYSDKRQFKFEIKDGSLMWCLHKGDHFFSIPRSTEHIISESTSNH